MCAMYGADVFDPGGQGIMLGFTFLSGGTSAEQQRSNVIFFFRVTCALGTAICHQQHKRHL